MTARVTSRLWLVAFVLAVASMLVSGYVGYRYVRLVDCLAGQDLADQKRTAAIALATDQERRADLALLQGAGTAEVVKLRAAAIAAREHTDQVRAENPPPAVKSCR